MSYLDVTKSQQSQRPGRQWLSIVPLEILDEIFEWYCFDSVDLGLLYICKNLQQKLRDHWIVRQLLSYCSPAELFDILGDESSLLADLINAQARYPQSSHQQTDTQPMCPRTSISKSTPGLSRIVQIVALKRAVLEMWQPFLERDHVDETILSTKLLRALLALTGNSPNAKVIADVESSFVLNDNEVRYSWTRLQISPHDDKIVIRDQLFNVRLEKTIPLLKQFWAALDGQDPISTDEKHET